MRLPKEIKSATHLSVSQLKERGWTDKTIMDILGKEDQSRANPKFKKASPMRLYLVKRVEKAEKGKAFLEHLKKRTTRLPSARKAVENKIEKLLHTVSSWEIDLPDIPIEKVLKNAIAKYNENNLWNPEKIPASSSSDKPFLNRICVNYLRHCLTNYDQRLEHLFGKTGKVKGYLLLNEKIYQQIALVYPDLAEECYSQLDRKTKDLSNG